LPQHWQRNAASPTVETYLVLLAVLQVGVLLEHGDVLAELGQSDGLGRLAREHDRLLRVLHDRDVRHGAWRRRRSLPAAPPDEYDDDDDGDGNENDECHQYAGDDADLQRAPYTNTHAANTHTTDRPTDVTLQASILVTVLVR